VKKLLILLTFLPIFIFSFNAYGYGGAHAKWWKNQQIVNELGLSNDQVNQIEGIFSSYKGHIIDLDSKLRKKQKELRAKLKDPNSTRQEILSLTDDVEKLKGELRSIQLDMFLRIRDVLTPEQRIKIQEIKARYGSPSR
jgi:Spy/CpxP family protein refolding chaperone